MDELLNKIKDMRDIAETHSPVLYDMACDTLHYLEYNKFYTHQEVLEMLNRRDDIELDRES